MKLRLCSDGSNFNTNLNFNLPVDERPRIRKVTKERRVTKLYSFVCAVWQTEGLAERCKLEAPSQVGGVQTRFGRLNSKRENENSLQHRIIIKMLKMGSKARKTLQDELPGTSSLKNQNKWASGDRPLNLQNIGKNRCACNPGTGVGGMRMSVISTGSIGFRSTQYSNIDHSAGLGNKSHVCRTIH